MSLPLWFIVLSSIFDKNYLSKHTRLSKAIKKLLNVTESKKKNTYKKKSDKKLSTKKRTYKKTGLKLKELQKLSKKYDIGKYGTKTELARKLIKRRKYDLKKSEYSALKKLI